MTSWNPQANDLFLKALERPAGEERRAFLDAVCGTDATLRAEVEALLEASAHAGEFLEPPNASRGATAEDPPLSERPGTMVGLYKLLEQIGEGGFGVVFLAEQTATLRRKVALKILKPGMDTRQVVARFEAERQALAIMDHPHIAKVLDGGTTAAGRPYFVMELVKGVPITQFCDDHKLSPRQRLELFLSVCQAVQHAHQKGVIHRDLKPSNVLVSRHDTTPMVKVIDFGVAKALGQELTDKTLFTGIGQMIGTPLYMSPEQAGMSDLDVDTRSDIYSLGVLLYELLTGTTPFTRERFKKAAYDEIRRIIREEEPPRPSTRLSESRDSLPSISAQRQTEPAKLTKLVRGELDWIVMKALEKDRRRRYDTTSAFAADVQRYLADEPVEACPPSQWYQLHKFARRNKNRLLIAGLILALVVVLGGLIGWATRDWAARQKEMTEQTRESLTRARRWIGEDRLALARQELAEARGRIGSNRAAFPNVTQELDALEAELDRFQRFQDLIEQAHQAEFPQPTAVALLGEAADKTWSAPHPSSKPARDAARAAPLLLQALSCYQVMEQDDALAALEGGLLGPIQVMQVRRSAYEELLWLADDVMMRRRQDHRTGRWLPPLEAARASLVYLGKAESAFGPTSAFYRLRAGCRRVFMEEAAARADEELAGNTPAVIALDHYLPALAAYDNRNKEEGIKQFEAALRVEPGHYWSLLGLGNCLLELGQDEQDHVRAATAFTGCIMKRPDHARAYDLRGFAHGKVHRLPEALADHSKALELDPKRAEAWANRGWIHYLSNHQDEAVADLTRALELDPRFALYWANRSAAYLAQGQSDRAIADSSRAIDMDPKFAAAWNNRGCARQQLNQLDVAVADYTRAIDLDPKSALYWNNRGWARQQLNQLHEAVADHTRAIELSPNDPVAWTNRSAAYLRLNQPEKGLADTSRAIELDAKFAAAWFNRAEAHRQLGQLEQAIADLRMSIRLGTLAKDVIPQAHAGLAKLINSLAWRLATSPDPKVRSPEQAVELAREAVELTPEVANHWNTLGAANYRVGDWKAAIEALEKSMKLGRGGDSYDWFFLAMAHWQRNNKDEARQWYDQAVQWMDRNKPNDERLRGFRAEARELLGATEEKD